MEFDYGIIEKLEKITAPLQYSWGVVGHLMGVKNSDDLREAHDAMQPSVVEITQLIDQSEALFTALKALKKRQSAWQELDEAQRRIVDSSIKRMEAAGVGLDVERRAEFNKIKLELSELSTRFSNNVLDSTKVRNTSLGRTIPTYLTTYWKLCTH